MTPQDITPTDGYISGQLGEVVEGVMPTAEDAAILRRERLEQFGQILALRRDKWVRARQASGIEQQWREDMDQYLGQDESAKRAANMMDSAREGFPVTAKGGAKPARSSVVVNITRSKTNAAESRVADMLLPTDDQNWGIQPTPVPELTKALESQNPLPPHPQGAIQVPVTDSEGNGQAGPDGNPVMRAATQADVAREQMRVAAVAADAMGAEIADQLEECSYNTEARLAIHDAAVFGTGIIMGPLVTSRVRRAWNKIGSAYTMELVEEKKPSSERVSPWYVYPDPACGENVHDGSGVFVVRYLPERQVRDLAKQPGYSREALRAVLEEGPLDNQAIQDPQEETKRQKMGMDATDKVHYAVWTYWGTFAREDLEACGVKLPSDSDDLRNFDGCVILINSTVVKAFLNPLDSGEMPIDFFVWERADGRPWGYGVPYMMRTSQKVLNAAWRQAMDNAGLAVGPQIVVKPGVIEPSDGQWTISGRKIWWCTDESVDVRQAFQTFEFNMHLPELQGIIEMALKFADDETSVPLIQQGERGSAPDTVGGMTILMNSSNVVLRRLAKQFDDMITRPHITRYYEWNMLFNDKDEIKGDFSIDARGTSALLVKDAQNQALIQLGQFMNNPTISAMVNWDEWFREILKSNHIDSSRILKSDEQIKQALAALQQNPQPAPAIAVAQIRAASAEKIEQAAEANRMQVEQAQIESAERIEASRQQLERSLAEQKNQASIAVAMIDAKLQDADLQSTERQVLEKIKATLAAKTMELSTQKELAGVSAALSLHKASSVAEPPSQVPGRAPDGHAFQQV